MPPGHHSDPTPSKSGPIRARWGVRQLPSRTRERSFNLEDAEANILEHIVPSDWLLRWEGELAYDSVMKWSTAEASYYFNVLSFFAKIRHEDNLPRGNEERIKEACQRARSIFDSPISVDRVLQAVISLPDYGQGMVNLRTFFLPLLFLLSPEDLFEIVLQFADEQVANKYNRTLSWFDILDLIDAIVLAGLGSTRKEALKEMIASRLNPSTWLSPTLDRPSPLCQIALGFGMIAEMEKLIRSCPDRLFANSPSRLDNGSQLPFLLTLSSDAEIIMHAERLCIYLRDEQQVRSWLERLGVDGIPRVVDSIVRLNSPSKVEAMCNELLDHAIPELVPHVLHLYVANVGKSARAWLFRYGDMVLPELLTLAELRNFDIELLELIRELHVECPDARSDKMVAQRIENLFSQEGMVPEMSASTTPEWLVKSLSKSTGVKAVRLPAIFSPRTCPPVIIEGLRLPEASVEYMLRCLKESSADSLHPFIKTLRTNVPRRNFDHLAVTLFYRWVRNGCDGTEKWILMALGALGSDIAARLLIEWTRYWQTSGQHRLSAFSLECLRAMGTTDAIAKIAKLASTPGLKSLKKKAQAMIEAIAAENKLTREELEDRIIPDLGLAAIVILDYGVRKFTVVLDSQLKPALQDADAKILYTLPRATKTDDALLAREAAKQWKRIKELLAELAKVQSERLEKSMCSVRTWTLTDFDQLLVQHPVMQYLVRRLVWYKTEDTRLGAPVTFRVSDDNTLADDNDLPITLNAADRVGIVHPVQLGDQLLRKWGDLFAEYDIIQPFSQLGRPVHHLESHEMDAFAINRFDKQWLRPELLVWPLERLGWIRGCTNNDGMFNQMIMQFPYCDTSAYLQLDGMNSAYFSDSSGQIIYSCFFVPGAKKQADANSSIKLSCVNKTIVSEVLNTLYTITKSAQSV